MLMGHRHWNRDDLRCFQHWHGFVGAFLRVKEREGMVEMLRVKEQGGQG